MLVVVDVRAAHADGLDLHQDLVRVRHRHWAPLDLYGPGVQEDLGALGGGTLLGCGGHEPSFLS